MDTDIAGKRASAGLAMVIGVLAVATGIANIGYTPVIDPLEPYLPQWVQFAAGFTGALTGFVMMIGAFGLRRRLRVAWYVTFLSLPVTAGQGVIQSSPLSVPLVVLSLVATVTLWLSREHFTEPLSLSTSQIAAGVALLGVQVYGTVGTYTLREEFTGVRTLLDAFYYTIVTASTVGYGDATAQTQVARLFSMSVVLLGTASFAIALGTLLGPAIEARFSAALGRVKPDQYELYEGHVLVLGYGTLTDPILSAIGDREECILVTRRSEEAVRFRDRGCDVVHADPASDEILDRVQVDDARAAIVATEDDADDAFSTLTARQHHEDLRIVAVATSVENIPKLRRAGADAVVSSPEIGARLLVRSALDEAVGDLSETTG